MFFFITIALKHSTIFFLQFAVLLCCIKVAVDVSISIFWSQRIFLSTFHSLLLKKFVSEALMSRVWKRRPSLFITVDLLQHLMVTLPVKYLDWKGVQDCICTVFSCSVWKKNIIASCYADYTKVSMYDFSPHFTNGHFKMKSKQVVLHLEYSKSIAKLL